MSAHRPGTDNKAAKADNEEQERAATRSFFEIRKEIRPAELRFAAIRGEVEIDQELKTRLDQIRRKSLRAWSRFPSQLIAIGKAFIEYGRALIHEGNRIAQLPDMPHEGRPLQKFNDVNEWKKSL
jgi:hypothetical protein